MCFTELIRGWNAIALEHKRLDLTTPERIDDFLVRQNGVCGQEVGDKKDDHRRTGQSDANAGSHCSKATMEQKHDDTSKAVNAQKFGVRQGCCRSHAQRLTSQGAFSHSRVHIG
jgi:hypothetical protein